MGRKIGKLIMILGLIFFFTSSKLRAEEEVKIYEIYCEEPNGENGYYKEAVDIEIEHFDERYCTKYQLIFPNGEEMKGMLDKESNRIVLKSELFGEGIYTLHVFMENEMGEKLRDTEQKLEIKIDGTPPELPVCFQYPINSEDEVLTFSEEMAISLSSYDKVSGMAGIYYQFENGEFQFIAGAEGECYVPIGFEGVISAYAVDRAGNRNELSTSKMLICENEMPKVDMISPEGFGTWYRQSTNIEIDVTDENISSGIQKLVCMVNGNVVEKRNYGKKKVSNDKIIISIDEMSEIVIEVTDWAGNVTRKRKKILFDSQAPMFEIEEIENYMILSSEKNFACRVTDNQRVMNVGGKLIWRGEQGEEEEHQMGNWKKDGDLFLLNMKLEKTGKYELYFEATDQAGNRSEKQIQMILDREPPVIERIGELDGRYLRFFEWTEDISEIVKDFTTYSYQLNLDGKICERYKRYTKEGIHTLELIVKDAAGNSSAKKVRFVIDHTAPEICIEENQQEQSLRVSTEGKNDFLKSISINGEVWEMQEKEREFLYQFESEGNYEIIVQAEDLAGNKVERKVQIQIKMPNRFFSEILGVANGKPSEQNVDVQEEKKRSLPIILAIIGGLGIGILGIRKILLKREDAG